MLYCVIFILSTYVHCSLSSNMLDKDNIIPEVIDVGPSDKVVVKYPNGKEVNFGEELTPTEVKDQPSISWEADPNAYYLLVMTDPDASNVKEVKHWLVGNIKGNDLSTGEIFAEYIGSAPPKGTGLHRYVFLIYKQSGKMEFSEPPRITNKSTDNRLKFSVKKFAQKYNLGDPVAGNYYKAQWDEYVDQWRKEIIRD